LSDGVTVVVAAVALLGAFSSPARIGVLKVALLIVKNSKSECGSNRHKCHPKRYSSRRSFHSIGLEGGLYCCRDDTRSHAVPLVQKMKK
jgi:hypothetical protein